MKSLVRVLLASSALVLSAGAHAAEWYPYDAAKIDPPFAADGKSSDVKYVPLEKASKPWKLCVSFPHMKDAYWLGVDYGVAEESKRLGVKMNLVEAGGYTELNKQISQIEDCVASGTDAVIIGAISADGLNKVIGEIAKKKIPVIDLVNGISSPDIAAKSLVSFYTMGAETGSYLAKKHPAGTPEVVVGWFPGPAGAGWVEAANKGFMDAVKGSAIKVLEPKYGDTGKEVQAKLVEDALQAAPNIRYVAGTAVTAKAAQGLIGMTQMAGQNCDGGVCIPAVTGFQQRTVVILLQVIPAQGSQLKPQIAVKDGHVLFHQPEQARAVSPGIQHHVKAAVQLPHPRQIPFPIHIGNAVSGPQQILCCQMG